MDETSSSVALEAGVPDILQELQNRFGAAIGPVQATRDGMPTQWIERNRARDILRYLKLEAERPYRMLYDLTAIDERVRSHREGQPASDFTVIYHLLSFARNADIRLKVALPAGDAVMPTITDIWPSANWYEREIWDMFGIVFAGHPRLRRILLPPTWRGHPLHKDHPARATEMEPFRLPQDKEACMASFVSFCSSMARKSSTPCPISAFTTAAQKKWASASPGIPIFPIPTASTIWEG